jgi:lysophospholipase L1-like esterase
LAGLILAGCLASTCSGNSTKPTPPPVDQFPTGPALSCPSPISLTAAVNQPMPVSYGEATPSGGAPPVAVSCTPASQTLFPIGSTTVTCTATDARQRTAACTFAVSVAPPPTITLTRFMAFGDSLTAGENGAASLTAAGAGDRFYPRVFFPPSRTYPGVLQQLLTSRYTTQSIVVFNNGQPGERVAERDTLSRFSRSLSGGAFEVVLIMEGANDLADRDSRITESAIANLREMIRDAKSRNVRPFLATLPPESPTGFRSLQWSLVPPFNEALKSLAASEGVTLVDVYTALFTDMARYVGFDGLHLTEEGYAKVADVFFTSLKTELERPPAVTPTRARFSSRR